MEFVLLRGGHPLAAANQRIGSLTIDELPPRRAGSVSGRVEFILSSDGILGCFVEGQDGECPQNLNISGMIEEPPASSAFDGSPRSELRSA